MNLETLRAVVDCLIPPDTFPGAYEAGVCDFLGRLFATDLKDKAEFFRVGLEALELESHAVFGKAFANLPSDEQTAILKSIEQSELRTTWPISPQGFFDMMVCTTAEGFYSDPQQGGNRGAVSWVMTGFEDSNS
jgi:hypothetical protein